jgi:hypothetical protein
MLSVGLRRASEARRDSVGFPVPARTGHLGDTAALPNRAPEPSSGTVPGRAWPRTTPTSSTPRWGWGLLNRFGVDGWELAGVQDYRQGGDGSSYWEAARLLTVYTFKRPISGTATDSHS